MTVTEGSSRTARADRRSEPGVTIAARDRIYPMTRALAAIIVPFLLLGVYALYVRTNQTRQLWAWEIRSPMSSLLASAYAAGVYYFTRAAFARRWHHIGRGLLPVLARP